MKGKKQFIKSIATLALSVVVLFVCSPLNAFASDAYYGNKFDVTVTIALTDDPLNALVQRTFTGDGEVMDDLSESMSATLKADTFYTLKVEYKAVDGYGGTNGYAANISDLSCNTLSSFSASGVGGEMEENGIAYVYFKSSSYGRHNINISINGALPSMGFYGATRDINLTVIAEGAASAEATVEKQYVPGTHTFGAAINGSADKYSFEWRKSGSDTVLGTGNTYTANNAADGEIYTVTIKRKDTRDVDGCTGSATSWTNTFRIKDTNFIPPQPIENLVYNGAEQTIFTPGQAASGYYVYYYNSDYDWAFGTTYDGFCEQVKYKNTGTYVVKYYITAGYPWDATIESGQITCRINPAPTTIGTVSYTGGTLYDDMDLSAVQLARSDGSIGGTLKLEGSGKLLAGTNVYNWKFAPSDGNYSAVNGTIQLDVQHNWQDATCTVPKTCAGCNATEGEELGHILKYEASGNVVTETCERSCGHMQTATLKADSEYTYTGENLTPVTIEYSDGWMGERKTAADIGYTDNNNAGAACAEIVINGKTVTIGFTVVKKAPEAAEFVFTPPANGIYDGNAKAATVAAAGGTNGMGAVAELKYYKNGTEIAAEEVKNAGTYTVKAVVAEGANYEAGTVGEWSFTIAKQPVAKPAADQTQFVYSSAPQTYNPAGFDETLMAVADNVRTDAGSQKVKVSLTDKDNYCWDDGTANETTADLEFDFEIKAKKITAVVTVEDKVYDGNTTASILSATLEGVETDDADAVVLVNGTAEFADKNTGRDKIIIFTDFALNGSRAVNYILKNSQPAGVTADIYAATVTVSGITAKNKIYDGTIAAEFDAANAQLTGCMVADDVRVDTAAATAEFADKNAGTKAVSFAEFALAGTDKDNYILTQPADVQASITPKVISIAWGGTSFTFNGSQQMPEATATGLIAGDSCEITVDGAQRNVGSGYKATAVSLSNANYAIPTDEAMNSILFEVIAQTLTKPAADTTRFVYNGYYQTYKIAENELYTVSGNVQRDSGNHKVTVSLKDKVNCTWTDGTTDDVTLVFTIAPKGLKVMVTVADKIYDGNTNATIAHSYLIGIVDGDDVGLIDGVPTFTSAEVGDNIPVKFTKFSLKHKDAYNYYVYSPKGIVASIKPLTVQTPVVAPTEKPGQEIIEKAEETFPTPTSTPTPIIEENNGEAEDITAEDTPAESKGYMATFPWWIFAVILVAGIVIFIILKRKSDDEE